LRTLRRTIQDAVGRDVCPSCGSTEIVQIVYGYPVEGLEDDETTVNGGCCDNPDETVSCLDCDNHFLGNFEKWQRAQMDSSKQETVLEIGAEGGTLSIVRQRNEGGAWEYWSLLDETTLLDVLSEDEIGNHDDLLDNSGRLGTFEDALIRFGQYPWFKLYPMRVSAEFGDLVLGEVEKRGGKEAAAQWTQRLQSNSLGD
jgi:hypothetical protein